MKCTDYAKPGKQIDRDEGRENEWVRVSFRVMRLLGNWLVVMAVY